MQFAPVVLFVLASIIRPAKVILQPGQGQVSAYRVTPEKPCVEASVGASLVRVMAN